jgi:hypothetical protein
MPEQAEFDFGEARYRIVGVVLKKNDKTMYVEATLPEDFGGKTVKMKRHIVKHNVVIV